MRNIRKAVAASLAILAMSGTAISAAPGAVSGKSSFTLEIRGFVPVICRVSVDTTWVAPSEDVIALGQMNEFCNDPSGYSVFVDHAPNLDGAALIVDGERVALSATGTTLIRRSETAARRSSELQLDMGGEEDLTTLSLRVVNG